MESNRIITLLPARVHRTYTGGMRLDEWFSKDPPLYPNSPESWLVSDVPAKNAKGSSMAEGVCTDKQGNLLNHILSQSGDAILGQKHVKAYGTRLGVLTKLIDADERLTVQVHPTREKALRYLNSPFGKTECWHFLPGTGEHAAVHVYVGFCPGVTKAKWIDLFARQDTEGMLQCLNRIPVHPWETVFIPGGMPHAIGAGCFLAEIQEPTDITLRVEKTTPSGHRIDNSLCHQGMGFENMFDCFDYQTMNPEETEKQVKISPVDLGGGLVQIIGAPVTAYFSAYMLTLFPGEKKEIHFESAYALIPLSGNGKAQTFSQTVDLDKKTQQLVRADTFITVSAQEHLRLLIVCPPQ